MYGHVDVTGLADEPSGLADVTGIWAAINAARVRGITLMYENEIPVAAIVPVAVALAEGERRGLA